MGCIFCDILSGKRTGHFLYEDDNHVAFLDKYPIDVGHSLVIPRKHHERITDMSSEAVGNVFSIVPKIAKDIYDEKNSHNKYMVYREYMEEITVEKLREIIDSHWKEFE